MGKADVFTGMSLTEKLIWLKQIKGSGGEVHYQDHTATGNPVIFTTNFAQNAKALSVSFTPTQSLNGLDHPFPGGSNKNLVGESLLTYGKTINSSGAVVDYTTNNRCATLNPITIDNTKSYVISSASTDIRTIYAVYNGSTFVRRIANVTSGTVLNISGGDRVYLCFYVQDTSRPSGQQYDYRKVSPTADEIQFEQGSTPTAYVQYDNLCPIVGFDGVDVLRTEDNLLGNLPTNTVTTNGSTFVTQGQEIIGTKNEETSAQAIRYIVIPNSVEPGNYYFIGKTRNENRLSDFFIWDTTASARAKKWDGTSSVEADFGTSFGTPHEVKIEAGHSYSMACRIYGSAIVGDSYHFVPMLLKADADIYKTRIDFGETQYGGTLNVKTGELTITDAGIESYNGEPLPSTWISDRDEYKAGATPTIGAQVVYKLATPQKYQLTAKELALLEGVNTITTDGDSLNVTYQEKV